MNTLKASVVIHMRIFRTDDPAADFNRWDAEQTAWLRKRPVCCYCGEHIQDDYFYQINDEVMCKDCLDGQFRKDVEDYIE